MFSLLMKLLVVSSLFFASVALFAKESTPYIDQTIHAPYLNVGKKEYLIVFYGYVGCTHVCMPIMDDLKKFYLSEEFKPYQSKTDFVFVNLLPKVDKALPDQFAKTYHKDFYGVHLSEAELAKLDKELQLFFTKDDGKTLDIDHSDHIYVIQRLQNGTFKLVNLYTTHPLREEFIINDLTNYPNK